MMFNLGFPNQNNDLSQIKLKSGEMLFVLGANGAGKSSLMQLFTTQNYGQYRKISAHRQTWMSSDTIDMTPSSKRQTEQSIQSDDQQFHARYRDNHGASRTNMIIYELISAQNKRARKIADAVDADNIDQAKQASSVQAPISEINDLLHQSNIPIINPAIKYIAN